MKCKNCTAAITSTNRVCSTCGYVNRDKTQELRKQKEWGKVSCRKCNNPMQQGDKQCPNCGHQKTSALAITSYCVMALGGVGSFFGLITSVSASSAAVDPNNPIGSSLGNGINFFFGLALAVIGGIILLVGGLLFFVDKSRKGK